MIYNWQTEFERWKKNAQDMGNAMEKMSVEEIKDAFSGSLHFGTGGLRGIMSPGPNRMNTYTVSKATQGLAEYMLGSGKHFAVVCYDSRHQSKEFARITAEVLMANGIEVRLFPRLMPTPCLSFATRYYGCDIGVMITASHNPSKYNGYKVYNNYGCQITDGEASDILSYIEKTEAFDNIKKIEAETAEKAGKLEYVGEDCIDSYINRVKEQSVLGDTESVDKGIAITYTPLNGTGREPVLRILKECGFSNIDIVKEQEMPDGDFPTCLSPNPELVDTLSLAIEQAKKKDSDLVFATDPDSDRLGVAVSDHGDFKVLTGNQIGVLLLNFICEKARTRGTDLTQKTFVKTIVTTELADKIAADYGLKTVNVLTGFKYIGEVIDRMEDEGREDDFLFGFEESCGYLAGSYVRDKDGVIAAMLVCEMYAYYKSQNRSLLSKLEEISEKYGYYQNALHSYTYEGLEGKERISQIMTLCRELIRDSENMAIAKTWDYKDGIDELPLSNVVMLEFEDGTTAVVRPSGTEPKLKLYITSRGQSTDDAVKREKEICAELEDRLNLI